jgi:hypothetical protein
VSLDVGEPEPQIWRYDGEWTRIPDPIVWRTGDNYDKVLARKGFTAADNWGWTTDTTTIYQHKSGERWRILFCLDASTNHEIEVIGLPNLIRLLADLAAISTASIMALVGQTLENLIFIAGDDADRERKRRLRNGL